jgi:type II secretory pathway pseudopilin PulG
MEGDAVKENVNGVTAYRYDLMLNRANIVKFYQNAADEFTKKYGNESPIRLDSETLDFLNSSSAEAVFDYINKNTQLSVWANAEGIPVKFQISMRIVPNSRKAITNQINLDLALNLIDINKSVTIETPADAMSVEDAYMLITGKTKEEINLEKQTQAIATIRYALEEYKRTNQAKTYPQSLQELTKSRSEVASQKAIDGDVYNYYDGPFIATIPTDAYTKQAFGYSSDGKTYALTYTINLPPYTSGASAYGLYEYDYSTTNNQKIYLKYIQGTNTSDTKYLSQEAFAASKIDTDKDRVADSLETYLGTDKNKKDTDGDTYTDYEEINRGSDPKGPGNLERSSSSGLYF